MPMKVVTRSPYHPVNTGWKSLGKLMRCQAEVLPFGLHDDA